jgi:hypothetical protein
MYLELFRPSLELSTKLLVDKRTLVVDKRILVKEIALWVAALSGNVLHNQLFHRYSAMFAILTHVVSPVGFHSPE